MRAINADELKTEVKKLCEKCKVKPHYCKDCYISRVVETIDNAPTIDPEIPPELLAQVVELIRDIMPQVVEIAKEIIKEKTEKNSQQK